MFATILSKHNVKFFLHCYCNKYFTVLCNKSKLGRFASFYTAIRLPITIFYRGTIYISFGFAVSLTKQKFYDFGFYCFLRFFETQQNQSINWTRVKKTHTIKNKNFEYKTKNVQVLKEKTQICCV